MGFFSSLDAALRDVGVDVESERVRESIDHAMMALDDGAIADWSHGLIIYSIVHGALPDEVARRYGYDRARGCGILRKSDDDEHAAAKGE